MRSEVPTSHRRTRGDPTIRTVINKTRRPLKISLPHGKTLHLAPSGRGQIHDHTLERPAFKKLLEAGDVEVLVEDGSPSVGTGGAPAKIGRSDQGHPATRNVARKGDR